MATTSTSYVNNFQVTQFTTIRNFAQAYNVSYDMIRNLLYKFFPDRQKGIMKPHEVKKLIQLIESGEAFGHKPKK